MNKKRVSLLAAAILLLGGFLIVKNAGAVSVGVSVVSANNGTSISADDYWVMGATSGWTDLGPITITETADSDIASSTSSKTLILKAPIGFQFRMAGTNPSIGAASGGDVMTTGGNAIGLTRTDSATITVSLRANNTNKHDVITIGGTSPIQVKPINDGVLASGNIYIDSSSTANVAGISKGTGGTNLGTLTEVAGALATVTVSPSTATVAYGGTQNFTASGVDQFGNPVSATYTWSTVAGTGTGSIDAAGLFTAGNSGTVTVKAASGTKSNTATVTVGVNPDIAIAQVVTDQINALPAVGDVTLDNKSAIEAARAAYNALTSAQQTLVTNLSTLETAEGKLAELETPPALSSDKAIAAFSFPSLDLNASINEEDKTISVTVPFGTSVTALSPTIVMTGVSVVPSSETARDFTAPVTYTVTAEDASTQDYIVTVTVADEIIIPDISKSMTSFGFASPFAEGVVNESDRTIAVKVPRGTDLTALVASFETENTESVSIDGVPQTSGETANDFSSTVTYVLDEDISYAVTVTLIAGRAKQPDPILPVEVSNIPMSISGDQEGVATYELENGVKVKLAVMSGTIDNGSTNGGATFNVRYGTMEDSVSNLYVDVTATDGNGNPVHQLLKKITISISGLFFPTDLQPLYAAYFDENGNSWTEVPGATFDAATGTASFQVDHLTRFAVFDRSRYAIKTPANGNDEVVPPVVEEEGAVLGNIVYADGTLIRGSDKKIYVLVNGKGVHIRTWAELFAKYRGVEIINVADDVLARYL